MKRVLLALSAAAALGVGTIGAANALERTGPTSSAKGSPFAGGFATKSAHDLLYGSQEAPVRTGASPFRRGAQPVLHASAMSFSASSRVV
jgi:hypothetical protein